MSEFNSAIAATISLPLSTRERDLFQIILEALNENHKSTIVRVAGGWVRDKVN